MRQKVDSAGKSEARLSIAASSSLFAKTQIFFFLLPVSDDRVPYTIGNQNALEHGHGCTHIKHTQAHTHTTKKINRHILRTTHGRLMPRLRLPRPSPSF